MRRADGVVDDLAKAQEAIGGDRGVRGRLRGTEEPQAARSPATTGSALILHNDESTLGLVRSIVESAGLQATVKTSAFEVAAGDLPETTRFVVVGLTAVDDRDLEIVALLRRRRPDAWIVVLFPTILRERAARALTLGADASLPEPFYPSELQALAQRALVRASSAVPAESPPAPPPAERVSESDGPPPPVAAAPPGSGNEIVERLAAGIAHCIRNPLQILELQLAAAETDGDVDVPAIRAELRRIAGVVEGVTRYAGRLGLPQRATDVASLVTGVFVSRDVGAAGAEIGVRLGDARVEILAAPELLRAGLESMRNRAVRVTPPEGKITVRTRSRTEAGRKLVEISVTDGGAALTDEQRARLFDPFPDEQSIQDGTGLELAALAGIVREHRGTIQALPAGATGTILVVRLPVKEVAAAKKAD